jgi:8-oxo-dGTP pyrophosphatase MutT (NUDIX family)
MENPWKTLSSDEKYDNPWIRVTEHQVVNPNGGRGMYGTVHFKNLAIGILPVDEAGNTWLVGQHRYPMNKYSWEIPEGGGKLGIDPLVSAKRELSEETGIEAAKWVKILEMDLSNSVTDERSIVYLATGLTFGKSHPEEDEALTVRKVSLRAALGMVLAGEITDAISVAALLYAGVNLLD